MCTNHIRTIPEFRHFGQMTQKSHSPGVKQVKATNSKQSIKICGEGYPNVFITINQCAKHICSIFAAYLQHILAYLLFMVNTLHI